MGESKRCFVHVGMPKTGTSYLQAIMWQSEAQLADAGLTLLPRRRADVFHLMLALRGRLRAEMDPPKAFGALERFRVQAAAAPGDRALVSHELLGGLDERAVARLLDALPGWEVHVVVTVRDLAGFLPSIWQQHVKSRGTLTYEEWLEDFRTGSGPPRPAHRLHTVLDSWGTHVPAERIHVVTVPPRSAGPQVLLERFCGVVGVDPATLDTETSVDNRALGMVQAELLRRVNVALGDRLPHRRLGYRAQAKEFLAREVLRPQGGRPATLPASYAAWCAEQTEVVVARLAGGGFDVVGDLAELRAAPAADDAARPEVGETELLEAAVAALADVLAERGARAEELGALRRRVTERASG